MASIMNDGDEDPGMGNYLSGGFEGDQKRGKRSSLKQDFFKLINLLTFHNVITNTIYIILLLCEFAQFLGFLFFKLNLAQTTTSAYAY